jgi:hypothetical protein
MRGKNEEVIGVFELLEEQYGRIDRPEIRKQCLTAVETALRSIFYLISLNSR